MTDRIISTFRTVFARLERYSAPQLTAPLTIQLFHDGR
jgi:hypothetical protein